ncbi:MAG: protein kinase domain-containing protein [Myxococcaceae bacterium]
MGLLGAQLGHYHIIEKLGAGGMGEVYRARDLKLHRDVALKLLPADLANNPEWVQRLTQEARAVAGLNHPFVVTIYSIEDGGERPFITMELVSGTTLDRVIGPNGLPTEKLLDLAVPLAEALAAAHAVGVVHRDLKPSNVMVTNSGQPKVLDFGLAKLMGPAEPAGEGALSTTPMLTRMGAVMGTLPYMSPEQLQGRPVDARSDIFSFGAMVFEMATGKRAHRGDSDAELISAILRDPPPAALSLRGDLPPELDRVIHRCLEKDPQRRYNTSLELFNDLKALRAGLSSEGVAPTLPSGPKRPLARKPRRALITLASIVVGLVVLAGGWQARTGCATPTAEASVAVLPFSNGTRDANVDYLIEGVTTGIINRLSESSALRVMSQFSVARFKDGHTDPLSAGKQLGVASVLTGQLSVHGERLVVDVALLDVNDGRQLWGERFERDRADFQSIEREIVGRASEKLRVKLSAASLARPAADPEAYDLFLRGRYALASGTEDAVPRAQEFFRRAIERDPSLAIAYAGLGETYVTQAWLNSKDSDETLPLAKGALKKAMELDPGLVETYLLAADVALYFDWDWATAGMNYRKAIELSPANDVAHREYANYLLVLDRAEEAVAEARKAQSLDPLSTLSTHELGWCLLASGRLPEAAAEFKKAIALNPNWRWGNIKLSLTYAFMHEREKALAAMKRADELLPPSEGSPLSQAWLANTAFLCGDPSRAKLTLERLEQQARTKYVDPMVLAGLYGLLDDKTRMVDLLERGFQARNPGMVYLLINRRFLWKRMADASRYVDLLKRMGFPRFQS